MKDPLSSRRVQLGRSGGARSTAPSPSAAVARPGFDPLPGPRAAALRGTSAAPAAEAERRRAACHRCFERGRRGGDAPAAIRVQSARGPSHLTKYQRRRHSPGRRFPGNPWPSGPAAGSSVGSRHVHRGRLNGSHGPLIVPFLPTRRRPVAAATLRLRPAPARRRAHRADRACATPASPQPSPGAGHAGLLAAQAAAPPLERHPPAAGAPHSLPGCRPIVPPCRRKPSGPVSALSSLRIRRRWLRIAVLRRCQSWRCRTGRAARAVEASDDKPVGLGLLHSFTPAHSRTICHTPKRYHICSPRPAAPMHGGQ